MREGPNILGISATRWLQQGNSGAILSEFAMGENNELKNRSMLIGGEAVALIQSANTNEQEFSKCNICTLDCTLEEMAVLKYLKENPRATQKEIAKHIGKSERTVKSITVALSAKGIIERKNGKRSGFWEIIKEAEG